MAAVPPKRTHIVAEGPLNRILTWMTAKGSGSMSSFRAQCMQAETAIAHRGGWPPHRAVAWNLSKLGHAEFGESAGEAGWRVAPPVLAASSMSGQVRAVLCGARPCTLIAALETHSGVGATVTISGQDAGPDLIAIDAENAASLSAAGDRLGLPVQWSACLAILAACPPLNRIALAECPVPVGSGWIVSRFSKSRLAWIDADSQGKHSLRPQLFRYRSDYKTLYMIRADGRAWSCEPAVGKFRVLTRRHPSLRYNAVDRELAIRVSCRPPALLERALVIASGRLPHLRDDSLIYTSIDVPAARAAATILGQRLY